VCWREQRITFLVIICETKTENNEIEPEKNIGGRAKLILADISVAKISVTSDVETVMIGGDNLA